MTNIHSVFRNPYYRVTTVDDEQLTIATRSDRRYEDIEVLRAAFDDLVEALRGVAATHPRLLVDLRRATGRNDPAFEAVMAELRPKLFAPFASRATLVKSAVGSMQVARHTRDDGLEEVAVVRSAAEAREALGLPPGELPDVDP